MSCRTRIFAKSSSASASLASSTSYMLVARWLSGIDEWTHTPCSFPVSRTGVMTPAIGSAFL